MREILFRGKCVDTGLWVYGSFVMDATEQLSGEFGADGFIRAYNPTLKKSKMFEVDRKTVGQYIGRDSNHGQSRGRKIFEGDIVNLYSFTGTRDQRNAVVQWDSYLMQWVLDDCCVFGSGDVLEVVGNIYDNPELAGGDDNGE